MRLPPTQRAAFAIGALALAAACGAKSASETGPAPAANAARGLRTFATDDPLVTEIALEAAQSLPTTVTSGGNKPLFAGVFVEGKRFRLASETVVRTMGYTATSSSRPARAECRAVNQSTGASTPIPCPASTSTMVPPTITFEEMKATADSAYVGVAEESSTGQSRQSCIVLRRIGNGWRVTSTAIIADARRCGR
jgi:hypothetical protein